MTYQCPRCKERGKTWNGDDPICGFDEEGNFIENNWNCATLNDLRVAAQDNTTHCDDYNVAVLCKYDVRFGILTWYKSRGRVDDFRDHYFKRGTLKLAQQLLGDIEPDC